MNRPKGWRPLRLLTSPLGRSLLYIGAAAAVFGFWLTPIRIQGISMNPTLVTGQYALVDRLAYRRHGPQRGDIVWLRGGEGPEPLYYVKRVVGLPGELLEIRGGRLYIDGRRVPEPYTSINPDWWIRRRIPSGYYYVVGDNRSMSPENHWQGILPRSWILGRVRWWRHGEGTVAVMREPGR